MSTLADVLKLTDKFISSPSPANAQALGLAYELMTKEEEDQVGGGCPTIMNE